MFVWLFVWLKLNVEDMPEVPTTEPVREEDEILDLPDVQRWLSELLHLEILIALIRQLIQRFCLLKGDPMYDSNGYRERDFILVISLYTYIS